MGIIQFAILGLGTGAVYAMLAQGLVLVYRGSGLLNFAQGAIAMFGAYASYQISVRMGAPLWAGLVGAVLLSAILGALIHIVVLRPMRNSSALARVIATLGILTILQSAIILVYSIYPKQVPSLLPTFPVSVFSSQLKVGIDILIIFAVGLVLTVALTLVYGRTRFGKITTAVAESETVAASLGHSPDVIAVTNWAMGSALAGLAGVLIAPIIYLDPTGLVLLIIPAVSTALIGEFASFPVTFCVALVLGIANSEITRYVSAPGWASAAPFIAIVAVLVVRGRGLPLRSFVSERLPAVGNGRVNPVAAGLLYVGGSALILSLGQTWASPLTATFATAIICLSVVVVTGYAGQLSLAQAVLAGVGALAAARLDSHLPFAAAVLLAMIITAAAGSVLGLPALRTRGITLAIVTLGLGGAVASVLFNNLNWAGGSSGVPVNIPTLFGWNIDPFLKANRYGYVVFTVLSLAVLGVANLRRGTVGRRLLAIRSNERAAAALGVNVAGVKLYAFAVASALASLGGTLLAFQQPSVVTNGNASYSVLACILIVGAVVVAGVGTPGGAVFGSLLLAGGIVSKIFDTVASIDDYLPLAGGILLILTLILSPDGIVEVNRRLLHRALAPADAYWRRSRLAARFARPGDAAPPRLEHRPVRADSRPLRVEGLSVAFGGVQAVQQVTLEVRPGQVHGVIGPNGAGKTTLIDAMTGFVRATSGSVWLGTVEITGWGVSRRARAGLSRSFQSLELFDDLTVLENLAVASDRAGAGRYIGDLIRPGRIRLNPAAAEAMAQFELGDIADEKPANVSFGRRKTVAIARAVASNASVLLLDEPAAGLDDHEADELARLIRMLADEWGIGILLVEHKTEMIMNVCEHVTVLDGGRVLTSGRPESVGSDPKVHAAYLGVP